jgi:hypothetical protein
MQVHIAKFFIAGLQYTQAHTLRLYEGEYLVLQKEPDNAEDAYAIAIYKENIKLGYVPRQINQNLYTQIDELEAVVEEYFAQAPPWERVLVTLFLEE